MCTALWAFFLPAALAAAATAYFVKKWVEEEGKGGEKEGSGPAEPPEGARKGGIAGQDVLGVLHTVIQARDDPGYHQFAGQVLEILRILAGAPVIGSYPGVVQTEVIEVVEFAERHVLAEYLGAYFEQELLLHEALLDRGLPSNAPLPA